MKRVFYCRWLSIGLMAMTYSLFSGNALAQESASSEFLNLLDWGTGRPEIKKKSGKKSTKEQVASKAIELPTWMEPLPKSYIRWEKVDTDQWLDLQSWKRETALKDQIPKWRTNRQDLALQETMGRVLHCIGRCQLYRGEGFSNAQFRTRIQEGDELTTLKDSYLWLTLLDGTMVRFSPETSITFKEINLAQKDIFYHVRLNAGQVIWLSRKDAPPAIKGDRETDPLFMPLPFIKANKDEEVVKIREEDLLASLESPSTAFAQAVRLRDLMQKNNVYLKDRKVKTFFVMPNGTVSAESLNGEFVVLLGDKSMMKIYKDSLHMDKVTEGGTQNLPINFYYRGYENSTSENLERDKWYVIDPKGRALTDLPDEEQKTMGLGEFFISHIPTIMVARELLLEQYSEPFLSLPTTLELYGGWGYRMWNKPNIKADEMQLRHNFLVEYSRREETTGLLVAEKFRAKMEAKGEKFNAMSFGSNFYGRAIDSYMANGEILEDNAADREQLNSTKNPFWKYVRLKYERRAPDNE